MKLFARASLAPVSEIMSLRLASFVLRTDVVMDIYLLGWSRNTEPLCSHTFRANSTHHLTSVLMLFECPAL